jgi:tRNA nucleotidyltransferase (CCA-adding enzyme)
VARALPEPQRPLVEAVVAAALEADVRVHLVGGPVRDLLLGLPVRDVDLVVSGALGAPELARRLALPGLRVVAHGRFGTVRLETADASLDLTTVRSESYAHPGALPSVGPGSLEDDLVRRDFTANALAIRLAPRPGSGRVEIVDPGSGVRDLEARQLRIFHGRSFHDDPTRALRAARLGVRLGFTLTRDSRAALRDALRDGAFGRVTGERFRRELEKLFEDATRGLDPAAALRRLAEWHVLPALEPGLELPRAAVAPLRRLGRALAEPPWPPRRLRPWVPGLSLWLAPLRPGLRGRTLRRFAVRGEAAARAAGFGRARERWQRGLSRARGRGAVDALLASVDEESLLALFAASDASLRRRIARYAREDRARRPPLDGGDLVALGFSGPAVGQVLARVRAAWLDGAVRDREDALALAREAARAGARARRGRRQARGTARAGAGRPNGCPAKSDPA